MISVAVDSAGVMAPGLPGWQTSLPLLRGEAPYQPEALPPLKPDSLKPNERRRTTQTIKLALVVADDALRQIERPAELLSVFASSDGDLEIANRICHALSQAERPVSPTHFHNSVHNAPAGYWSIAYGYRQASTSIGGIHGSFSAGLLEAAVQAVCEAKPVLLVAYDLPSPDPLGELIPSRPPFATALLLSPTSPDEANPARLATLNLQPVAETRETALASQAMEQLRQSQPSARALPLLSALARQQATHILLPYLPDLGLSLEVTPC